MQLVRKGNMGGDMQNKTDQKNILYKSKWLILLLLIIGGAYLVQFLIIPLTKEPIELPPPDEITSVDIFFKGETVEREAITHIDDSWIRRFVTGISAAQPTRKITFGDKPDVKEYVQIDVNTEVWVHTLYMYEENKKYYIWVSRTGIYLTSEYLYEMITEKE